MSCCHMALNTLHTAHLHSYSPGSFLTSLVRCHHQPLVLQGSGCLVCFTGGFAPAVVWVGNVADKVNLQKQHRACRSWCALRPQTSAPAAAAEWTASQLTAGFWVCCELSGILMCVCLHDYLQRKSCAAVMQQFLFFYGHFLLWSQTKVQSHTKTHRSTLPPNSGATCGSAVEELLCKPQKHSPRNGHKIRAHYVLHPTCFMSTNSPASNTLGGCPTTIMVMSGTSDNRRVLAAVAAAAAATAAADM